MMFKKPISNAPIIPLPFHKKVLKFIFKWLKYPFVISGKFSDHQKGVNKIIEVLKYKPKTQNFDNLFSYIKIDTKAKNYYIYLPIALAFISFVSIATIKNKKNYVDYYTLLTLPVEDQRFTAKIGKYIKKGYFAVKFFPVKQEEFFAFSLFYIIAIAGARFVSYSPVLKTQESIQKKLLDDGKVDQFGNPWMITWTFQAILLKTYGANKDGLFKDASFWTDINFPRTQPKTENQKDMQLMIFSREEEMNRKMEYNFKDYLVQVKMSGATNNSLDKEPQKIQEIKKKKVIKK